jgi:nucleoside-diphosphate-sugar epimerase
MLLSAPSPSFLKITLPPVFGQLCRHAKNIHAQALNLPVQAIKYRPTLAIFNNPTMANILIIGCGAVGSALAAVLSSQGHTVTGLKRQPPSHSDGIHYIAADITSAAAIDALDITVDVVFFIVAAGGRSEQGYRGLYVDGLQHVLAKLNRQQWFFVSSTSVYAQSQGEWVDEDSPAEPTVITAQLIRQAEQTLWTANPTHVVVRFSGIYGPGREHLLRMARQTPAIQQQPAYFTNRIHQEDCVGVLAFLFGLWLAKTPLQPCYLASDDDPAPLWEVVSWLAARQNSPVPIAKIAAEDADANKRCRNARLKALGYAFRYASYQDGYAGLIL